MIGKAEKMFQERRQRQGEADELLRIGWKSTGDIPFIIAHSLGRSSSTIQTQFMNFLKESLKEETQEYRLNNLKKVGRKTFISPDLIGKVEEKIRDFYKTRR